LVRQTWRCGLQLHRSPTLPRIPGDVSPWLGLLRFVYPNEDENRRIELFLAHPVQRPYEKINHNLFLGGPPGIGKDSIIEPVKRAVGPWNCIEVSPQSVLGGFTGFLRAVICASAKPATSASSTAMPSTTT
jgi:hypothetical protein